MIILFLFVRKKEASFQNHIFNSCIGDRGTLRLVNLKES